MHSPSFPEIRLPHLDSVPLPPVARVRLEHPESAPLGDVEEAVDDALGRARRLAALPAGARVALAVGSRGIAGIEPIVARAVGHLKERGLVPFVVPAMGSHGGGTVEGQVKVLASLGVTEERVGAPVEATMEVVDYGASEDGIRCKFDRNAAAADAVVLVARVKSHTSFDRPIESGLTKMVAVVLGKAEGARNVHLRGPYGLSDVIPALARIALAESPIAYGLALVEDGAHRIVHMEGVEPEAFLATDERLLKRAKSLLARLPFHQIDVLVVEQIGKEISGTGMDYAVTGRTDIRGRPNPDRPFVHKIAVLGLTAETAGNAVGIGLADYTTREVANGLDLKAIYMNAVTATFPEKARVPVVLPDERTAIRAALATCWRAEPRHARYCQIRSTLHLDQILASPELIADIEGQDGVDLLSEPQPLLFAPDGRLLTRLHGPTAAAAQ
jgi:hypothetical protein